MDPTESLNIILNGLEELQDDPDDQNLKSDIASHLTSLAEWLIKGGSCPDVEEAFRKAGYVRG
jgi:hypothetical protein